MPPKKKSDEEKKSSKKFWAKMFALYNKKDAPTKSSDTPAPLRNYSAKSPRVSHCPETSEFSPFSSSTTPASTTLTKDHTAFETHCSFAVSN